MPVAEGQALHNAAYTRSLDVKVTKAGRRVMVYSGGGGGGGKGQQGVVTERYRVSVLKRRHFVLWGVGRVHNV